MATEVNATAVMIVWQELDLEQLIHYTVLYSAVGSGRAEEKSVTFPTSQHSGVVGGLEPGQQYVFQVMAVAVINGSDVDGERSAVSKKQQDVLLTVMAVVEEECECTYSIRSIDSELFRCFEGSDSSVTWRTRLLATSEVGEDSLSSVLEDWVSGGGSVMVGSLNLSLVPQCSGHCSHSLLEEKVTYSCVLYTICGKHSIILFHTGVTTFTQQ